MKKVLISVLSASLFLFACKSKTPANGAESNKDSVAATTAGTTAPAAATATQPANTPKTYTLTFSPDTLSLGKQKEASIKVTPVSATDLSDPDGKSEGIELSFKISVTNKEKIGGNSVNISSQNFRMALDNNTSVSESEGTSVYVQPESTKESDVIKYRIPAGAKPKALNLFYDETRASVAASIK